MATLVNLVNSNNCELKLIDKDTKKKLLLLQSQIEIEFNVIRSLYELKLLSKEDKLCSSNIANISYLDSVRLDAESTAKLNNYLVNRYESKLDSIMKEYNKLVYNLVQNNISLPKEFIHYKLDITNKTKINKLVTGNGYYQTSTNVNNYSIKYINISKNEEFSKISNKLLNVDLNSIKDLANRLNFVIIPLEYLSDEAWKIDKKFSYYNLKTYRDKFINLMNGRSPIHKEYVLCPIRFLDLMSAATSDKYYSIYYGTNLSMQGTMINLNMPLFRSIFSSLNCIDKRVEKLEEVTSELLKSVESIKGNIKNLQSQLNTISDTVNDTIMNEIRKNMESKLNFEKRIKSLEQWRLCMMDPMIFSVEHTSDDIDITSNNYKCTIGFAWGPEFSEEFVNELKLSIHNTSESAITIR